MENIMLNLQALEDAHLKYKDTVLKEADACGKEIKLITKKFLEMDISDTYYSWTERGSITVNDQEEEIDFSMGLVWDSKKYKIFYWFDDSTELKVLAGETAVIRASVRPKLNGLVENATKGINTQIKELVSTVDEESEEDSLGLSDEYEPDSLMDRMMINGEQE